MSKTSGNIPESRNSNSVPLEPSVQILQDEPVGDVIDMPPSLDVDIDQLSDELGLGDIHKTLKLLSDKITQLSNASHPTESVHGSNSPTSSQFDPSGDFSILTGPQPAPTINTNQITLESSEFLPSIFEEAETVGPDVADAIAQRVNDAVSKKPLETKFKELQDKYRSPKNCQFLCVPKVNLELWHDLPRATKSKDLGLQEIQKNVVKSAQPMIQLLDLVLRFQHENKPVEAASILPLISDAVTLLGHASYLTSLKRREFLRPDIAPAYQSVCSKSNPVTTNLFGDELPKHIKEIGEVNKIARKTMYRTNAMPKRRYEYKANPGDSRFHPRGSRRAFLGSRGQKGPYFDRRSHIHQSVPLTKGYKEAKDRI